MEPKSNLNTLGDNANYINEMELKNDSSSKQAHFLTLRKNKRMNLHVKRFEPQKESDKYKLNQNSYDSSNEIIQKFFNSEDKPGFLFQLISNLNNTQFDPNLIKFILVQSNNFYDSQKESNDNLKVFENFFNQQIVDNLINIMSIMKNDLIIIYNTCSLLVELTYKSTQITKIITLNIKNIQNIFECLSHEDKVVNVIVLNLLYNCYLEDEDSVNRNCNIGLYIFGKLNDYYLNFNKKLDKTVKIDDENLKILVSFLSIIINKNTSSVYRNSNLEVRNNIINYLILICKDAIDENLKLDSHDALERVLGLMEPEDINLDDIGVCNLVNIFLPHIKLESNNPNIIESSMQVIDKLSYLCDVEIFINKDLIDEFENILITLNDMNTNQMNPKPFYKNFKKKNINSILNSLAIILTNTITYIKHEKYISKETNIINNLTLSLKINELKDETIVNIYGFFKDFMTNKDNCVKVILANFLDVGIIDSLNKFISQKSYEPIQSALDICLLMLKECNDLLDGKGNIIKIYLERKGFNEILNLIIGADFGNTNNSELAKNIQENFFK